ncbi:MAG: lectin-like protein [Planctomycetota bacterium]
MNVRLWLWLVLWLGTCSSFVAAQEFNPATGLTYFRTDVAVPFFVGRAQALSVGGHLVDFNDVAEDQWVNTTFPGEKWIGLSDAAAEGNWQWDSGAPLVYTNWQGGVPGGSNFFDYAYTVGSVQGWLTSYPTLSAQSSRFAVVESEAVFGSTVENVEAVGTVYEIDVSWTNGGAFTSIEIYRDVELIDVLPGNATSYTASPTSGSLLWIQPRGGSQVSRPVTVTVAPDTLGFVIENVVVGEGQTQEVRTFLQNDLEVHGYSYGVCHDPAEIDLLFVDEGSIGLDVVPTPGLDFHQINVFEDSFSVGVVLFGAGITRIPVGYAHEMNIATYTALAPAPTVVELDFCVTGSPPTDLCIVPYSQGSCESPDLFPGSVTIAVSFRRGDTNSDGVVDLADPIHHLRHLFDGDPVNCRSAIDTNDDGQVDLADPIYALIFLFDDGAPPPSPGTECGPDPTPDGLDCLDPSSCP